MIFETAYRQLEPAEKAFVDDYVSELETLAVRSGDRLDVVLDRQTLENQSERAKSFLARNIIRAAISERVREIVEQMELSAHRVIKELSAIAFASLGDYMELDIITGQPTFTLNKCTPEQLSAIKKIEIEESIKGGRKFKFELHDKLGGLDKFMRYMGLLDPENPHWAAVTDRAKRTGLVPIGANDDAAEAYSRRING